jgi:zinc D-Ala-D-Ala carboxypeptidase
MQKELSSHFTLDEMVFSQLATRFRIDNTPPELAVKNLQNLCIFVLEDVRKLARDVGGSVVVVSSGYRSPALNKKAKGSPRSQHMVGEAADITVPGLTTQELFDLIVNSNIQFDQIIQEFDDWVHISYRAGRNRRSILYATFGKKDRVVYSKSKK